MKKVLLSVGVILAFVGYSLHQSNEGSNVQVGLPTPTSQPTDTQGSSFLTNTPTPTASGNPPAKSTYKDGTYTGIVTDAFYGPYQVQAVISGGKISDIVFLQYPNDRGTSREINSQAMPLLKQEAITAKSARVDIVSGATQSSGAFQQSLQSALDKARI